MLKKCLLIIPQILIMAEKRDPATESAGVSTAQFLIKGFQGVKKEI